MNRATCSAEPSRLFPSSAAVTRSYVAPLALIALFLTAFVWVRFGPPIGPPQAQRAPAVAESHTRSPPWALGQRTAPPPVAAPLTLVAALSVPVAGVSPDQLQDTWGQARSEGRRHEGIDIMAPAGTPVYAAADGRIAKFFESARGGITIYEFDPSQRFVYYYAHLSSRAPGLREGDSVRQGQVIGFVGMTGNAPVTHLHFEIERLTPERHWWQAEAMNPYPYLRAGRAPG